jgi:hypothetical protein
MSLTNFVSLSNPTGITLDKTGNILINHASNNGWYISKVSPGGFLLKQTEYGSFLSSEDYGSLATIPSTGNILQLRPNGDLVFIDSDSLLLTPIFNIKALNIDTSSGYDILTGGINNKISILPNAPQTVYGDIAILERNNQLDVFITAKSSGVFPFVIRLRFLSNDLQSVKVLAYSSGTTAGNVNLSRGVAVNSQGTVLTTFPIPSPVSPEIYGFFDAPVSFGADFPENRSSPPQIRLQSNNTKFDIASQGMTTDKFGNFYVVTNSVGSAVLGSTGGGTLAVLSPDVNSVISVESGPILSSFRDVVVSPIDNRAFVTSSQNSVISFSGINGLESKKSDFNKDGKTDILLNNPTQGWNTAWLMDGTNYAGFANVFGSAGYRPVATADFNKDGKTDLVVNNPTNNFNSVWFMDGGNYVSGAGLPTAAGWQIKGAADFNGDGNTDILLNNTSTSWNTVWFLGGANGASYTGFGNLPVANGWNITGVADFNGDGNSDILLNNPTQGWNSVWFLNDTTYIGFANLPSAPGWQSLGTGDFNNDGKPDLLLNNLNSNWNTIWLMNGTNYAGFANLPTAPAGWQISGMA